MAGSLKYFRYTTDTDFEFGILMDEDWGELVANVDVGNGDSGLYGIPVNLQPRYALYRSQSGKRQLKIAIGANDATTLTLPATINIAGASGEVSEDATDNTMILYSLVGERYRQVIGQDTGMIDGDLT